MYSPIPYNKSGAPIYRAHGMCCQYAHWPHCYMRVINLTSRYFTLNFKLSGSARRAAAAPGICNILPGHFGRARGRAAGGRRGWPVDRWWRRRADDSSGGQGGQRQRRRHLTHCRGEAGTTAGWAGRETATTEGWHDSEDRWMTHDGEGEWHMTAPTGGWRVTH